MLNRRRCHCQSAILPIRLAQYGRMLCSLAPEQWAIGERCQAQQIAFKRDVRVAAYARVTTLDTFSQYNSRTTSLREMSASIRHKGCYYWQQKNLLNSAVVKMSDNRSTNANKSAILPELNQENVLVVKNFDFRALLVIVCEK